MCFLCCFSIPKHRSHSAHGWPAHRPSAAMSCLGRALRMDSAMMADVSAYSASTAPTPVKTDSTTIVSSKTRIPCETYTPATAPTAAGKSISSALPATVSPAALLHGMPHT